jgi:hypothetical protein
MSNLYMTMRLMSLSIFAAAQCAQAQDGTNSQANADSAKLESKQRFQALMFTTPAYQKEVVRLVLAEANNVAQQLNLPEQLPIVESNLVAAYISPLRMAQRMGTFGNITTSNYTYYVSIGNKFSYLERSGVKDGYERLRKDFLWPMSRMDTNAAYKLAVQSLAAVSMNVAALTTNCEVHIDAYIPEGKNGKHFVPLYWVYWTDKTGSNSGPLATVELLEPTKTIRQLRVNQSEYILRPPLVITNLDFFLSQTNTAAGTNAPGSP